ncbi:MAG TPA: tyrosine-type recombinase/integrase [Candidatus Angelobacter sp.]|nr:tyrosine-type recombinase/integrase [Candidatus Angelobacter sp.]
MAIIWRMLMRRLRKLKPTVVPYRWHPTLRWTVAGYYVNGKRVRRFFETKQEAENFVEEIRITVENLGLRATEIDQRFHVMALECHDILAPYSKTLADATHFYRNHLNAVQQSCTVEALIGSFLPHKEAEGVGQRYRKDVRNRLKRFQKQFGQRIVATIHTLECDDWLRSLAVGACARNSFRQTLNVLFAYALARGFCTDNPISKTAVAKVVDKPVGILTPDQIRNLLYYANNDLIPVIAIGAFAGIRTAELGRLDWNKIHIDRCFIEVSAASSKTASRRLVTILPNLSQWLTPLARNHGKVMPVNFEKKMKAARKAAEIEKWPSNALRHSYASYHLAKFQDAPALALQMGHTTTGMLFEHYREVVTPEAAEQYWKIQP